MWRSCCAGCGGARCASSDQEDEDESAPPGPLERATSERSSVYASTARRIGLPATDLETGERLRHAIQDELDRGASRVARMTLPPALTTYAYPVNAHTVVQSRLPGDTVDAWINANRIDDRTLVMAPPPAALLPMLHFVQAMLDEDVRLIVDLGGGDASSNGVRQGGTWSAPYLGRATISVLDEAPSTGSLSSILSMPSVWTASESSLTRPLPVTVQHRSVSSMSSDSNPSGATAAAGRGGGDRLLTPSDPRPKGRTFSFRSRSGSARSRSSSREAAHRTADADARGTLTRLAFSLTTSRSGRQRASNSVCSATPTVIPSPRAPILRALSVPNDGDAPADAGDRSEPMAAADTEGGHRVTHLQIERADRLIQRAASLRALARRVDEQARAVAPGKVALQDEDGGLRCAMVWMALALQRAAGLTPAEREALIVERYVALCRQRGEHLLGQEADLAVLVALARDDPEDSHPVGTPSSDRD